MADDLQDFLKDDVKMDNVWNKVVSKNLPGESQCTQEDFYQSLLDAAQAFDWVKVNPDVMESLYDYGHDEDQDCDDADDLIETLRDFINSDEARGENKVPVTKVMEKFFGWLLADGDKE